MWEKILFKRISRPHSRSLGVDRVAELAEAGKVYYERDTQNLRTIVRNKSCFPKFRACKAMSKVVKRTPIDTLLALCEGFVQAPRHVPRLFVGMELTTTRCSGTSEKIPTLCPIDDITKDFSLRDAAIEYMEKYRKPGELSTLESRT